MSFSSFSPSSKVILFNQAFNVPETREIKLSSDTGASVEILERKEKGFDSSRERETRITGVDVVHQWSVARSEPECSSDSYQKKST